MMIIQLIASCIIVAFGTPSSIPLLGIISSVAGYALFFLAVIDEKNLKRKFVIATLWFAVVTMIQYSWILTHPFYYIYALYAIGPLIIGSEFGLLALLVTRERIASITGILAIAGTWVLLEWFRLFWLMGLSFNTSGMALASTIYSLQIASIGGAYFLSFWVMLTNLLFLKAIALKKSFLPCALAALAPYIFGFLHLTYHETVQNPVSLNALLVQPAFEVEESTGFQEMKLEEKVSHVLSEWKEIAHLIGDSKKADIIILPESVVPFASKSCLFPKEYACQLLETTFSKKNTVGFPFMKTYQIDGSPCDFVCNGYFAQSIAEQTNTPVLIGMEHSEEGDFYSSAMLYRPKKPQSYRYDKQVLVPMAEYIPFKWLQEAAKSYGISGSFKHGGGAKLFELDGFKCGVSICYEETIGEIVRQNKLLGAQVLINVTNDGWYPHSNLPKQHLDLAILRSVELGMPLLRACNTGITCAVDSLGRMVKVLGKDEVEQQTLKGALFVTLPIYNYWTPYSQTGDTLIIAISLIFIGFLLPSLFRFKK